MKDWEVENIELQRGSKVRANKDCGVFMLKFIAHIIQGKLSVDVVKTNISTHRKEKESKLLDFSEANR